MAEPVAQVVVVLISDGSVEIGSAVSDPMSVAGILLKALKEMLDLVRKEREGSGAAPLVVPPLRIVRPGESSN